jgi:radical SAM superfamily enzyme YgiQ (UPF0313 family)/2-polyprenyl-3-methyl-5-hydroxy-6-metoxy-1,4-benzoquinol methylase
MQEEGGFHNFRRYILHGARLGDYFDLILVGGRARVECLTVGWDRLSDSGVMLLHDDGTVDFQTGIPNDCSFVKLTSREPTPETISLLFMSKSPEPLRNLLISLRGLQLNARVEDNLGQTSAVQSGRILFINTYYSGFIKSLYQAHPDLSSFPYWQQKRFVQEHCFGDSDFYSSGMIAAGWAADDIVINCTELQASWSKEQGCSLQDINLIAREQIRRFNPDVIYLQDLGLASTDFLESLRPYTRLIAGQIASPLPPHADLGGIDILFSSFPHFIEEFRRRGKTAWYQPLAFEPRVLQRLPRFERAYPATFVGGISPHHGKGFETLQTIAELVPVDFWGYGADLIPPDSPVRQRHHGEAWGMEMFAILQQSAITLNRHIDVAGDYANNMRLFEATGCGALLITDYRSNLNELFKIGKEVVAYRSPEEAAELIKYYQNNPEEAAAIATAGQERTLRDHTYTRRMEQSAEILERHLRYNREKRQFQFPASISAGYRPVAESEITVNMIEGWKDEGIPAKQRGLVQYELEQMYNGQVRPHFGALADLVRPIVHNGSSVLELGCASGYYYEIMEYLLGRRIDYTGVDYSDAMIAMARDFYPRAHFFAEDAKKLSFTSHQFDLVISSCILLHVPDYRQHIEETARVAREWIVAHRTPVCRTGLTRRMAKYAYEVETVEFCFNEDEFLGLFSEQGFDLVAERVIHEMPDQDEYCVSYLFKRKPPEIPPETASTSRSNSRKPDFPAQRGPVVLVSRAIAFTFPLSYAYLAGELRRQGEDVRILFKDIPAEALVRQIMSLEPLVVGFGSLYPELAEIKTLIRMLDKAGRRFPVVIGGQMVTPIPEFSVKVTGADYGILGEGELIFAELVQRLRTGVDVSDVKGLVIRDGDDIINNGAGAYISDLSTGLPPIPYDLFPVEQWLPIGKWYANNLPQPHWKREDRVINVHGGRGCPFSCNFCYHHSKPRYRDIPVMMDEAQEALIRFDANMLYFSDDLVLATPNRARQLIDAIGNLDRPVSFQVSTRFDILARMDNSLLRDLKRAGCRSMGLGLESGSDRILKIIGKNCTVQQIDDGLDRLYRVGIYPTTAIMVGQYSETLEDAAASIALMQKAVQRDPFINFAFTLATPFPGSALHRYIFEKGLLKDEQEFYDRYFSDVGDFKQVVNLSSMHDAEVKAALLALQRVYAEEKQQRCI